MLDCTYRVQVPHRTGQLARVMGAIAEGEGLIGDVVTISTGRETSVREITVEVRDIEQAERIAALLDGADGVRVLWYQDRALIRHEGGKLHIDAVRRVATVQEMRDVYTPGVARVCLAIPGQVVEVVDVERRLAKVDVAGVRRNVNIGLLDESDQLGVSAGDWVLIHVGFAISKVDEEEAHATLSLLEKMGNEYEQELEELRASVIE